MKRLLPLLLLTSCQCPQPINGIKQPCHYVGPAISGSVGFNGVTVGVTLWGDPTTKPAVPIVAPDSVAGIPISTK